MTVSARAPYTWRCEECDQQRTAPAWRVVDARERADVLEAPGAGVSWLACPGCGTRTYVDAPLLVLRPGAAAPMLLGLSMAELRGGPPQSALAVMEEAARAGALRDHGFAGQAVPLPRRLLSVVLTRDLDRDLADPEAACEQLEPEGQPTIGNYRMFLQYLAESIADTRVNELLNAVLTSPPDELAELLRTHPELIGDTKVRDAGREELRAAVGTPLESVLDRRQRLLEELCDGRTPQSAAVDRYFESLSRFGGDLRTRLHELYERARASEGPEGIPIAREALALAADLGEEEVETDLAAMLGERLVGAVHAGLDADLSEAYQVLAHALARLPEGSLEWVQVANNLASAHYSRDDGDRLEVWGTARDLLARASGLDRREHPEFWARIQTNYGLLLAERPGGGPADLTLGIDRIRAGLEERSPRRSTVNWAYSMVNLGLLLYRRREPDDLREAEQCYRAALHHLRADDDPALWSQTQCNLAHLLLARDPVDAHGARAAATAALDLATARPGLLNTGRVMWLLAQAGDLLEGPDSAESTRLRREALAVTPPTVSPSVHLNIARELVNSYAEAERWTEAADVASDMLTAVNALFDAQVTVASRRGVLVQVDRLARWTAFLLARAGRPERAVEALERGLACELSVVAGRGAVDLEALEGVDPVLADRYRLARSRYGSAVTESATTPPGGLALTAPEQAEAERALRAVVDEIRAIPGFEDFLRTTELRDIVRAAGGLPLAYLVNAPWGSYVLTIPGARPTVRAVLVPEVSSLTVTRLLMTDLDDPDDDTVGLWLVQQASRLTYRRELPAALERLIALEPLMRPLARLLADDPRHEAVVVPTGLLGLVPLHAVPLGPDTDDVLDDIGTLIAAPSAAVYEASRARAARLPQAAPRLVAVTDPDGSLPGSRTELAEIRTLFASSGGTSCAVGADATVGWVLDHLAEASYLHLSCHGSAGFESRGGSLALADGHLDMDVLVRHQLPVCRLTVASACQSGHYAIIDAPDEFLGLPAGFLQAGAACAVTSLWLVDDMATAVLMTRFYELLFRTGAPVTALRRSRRWLRGLTWDEFARYTDSHPHLADLSRPYVAQATSGTERPFASPVHWGAFTAWGA
ncbi:CHAT domain-containing protein [Streptomyces aureoverticillatus]|uniref:CHAT domain-containing protein n=1 Tax=Streptomyces aureoverticillatus TaxID=66871 RepID=UPI0013D8ECD9|nr:CHAT domain-containing protein [Streptomyces aureoverticillatus]QIB41959.1 CHAT domain-containing protein [Streptomyces aureoverticillatus]